LSDDLKKLDDGHLETAAGTEWGKDEVVKMLDELAVKREWKKRAEILKEIKKTPEELADVEYNLINRTNMILVMLAGRIAYFATEKLLIKYFN